MSGEDKPAQIVVTIHWTEGGHAREGTFGPWQADEDDSHIDEIQGFMRDWREVTGCRPDVAIMAVAFDPAEWLADHARERM